MESDRVWKVPFCDGANTAADICVSLANFTADSTAGSFVAMCQVGWRLQEPLYQGQTRQTNMGTNLFDLWSECKKRATITPSIENTFPAYYKTNNIHNEKRGEEIPEINTTQWRCLWGAEVKLHDFWTSALFDGQWLDLYAECLSSGDKTPGTHLIGERVGTKACFQRSVERAPASRTGTEFSALSC
jgi:hypothetical protein